jgi:AcrR family transcriptional regulator
MAFSSQAREARTEQAEAAARLRSADHVDKLVDAARALAHESGDAGFTVNQVVGRAGLSLKTFYRQFPAGKDDLLLALFEADSRAGAALVASIVGRKRDPIRRLEAWVTGLASLVTVGGPYATLLVREHLRLAQTRPADMRRALAPLLDSLTNEVAAVRPEDARGDAALILHLVLSHVHAVALGDGQNDISHLWAFCRRSVESKEPVE